MLGVRHELLICSVSDENSACSVVMSQWFRGIECNLKYFLFIFYLAFDCFLKGGIRLHIYWHFLTFCIGCASILVYNSFFVCLSSEIYVILYVLP